MFLSLTFLAARKNKLLVGHEKRKLDLGALCINFMPLCYLREISDLVSFFNERALDMRW